MAVFDKASPYLEIAEKNNPEMVPRMYQEMIKDIQDTGAKLPPGMETYRPGMLGALRALKTEITTAKERAKGVIDLQKAAIAAQSRERAAGIRAGATVDAATIRAANTGSKDKDYTTQLAALETKETTGIQRIQNNAQKEIDKLTGGVEPSTPEDVAAVKNIKDKAAKQTADFKASIQRSRTILQKGRKAVAPDMAQLQAAYDAKATEVNAMPDGPGKQTALKQLEDWRVKNLAE
jgi:hypothetical protein